MATATVNYRAELSDLKKKLASITDITAAEARKMASDLNKSMKSVERVNKKAASSFKEVGGSAGDAESSLRAISGAIGMVNPQAEKAINVFAELGGATEGVTRGAGVLGLATLPALATALAAVSAAAVVGYIAWSVYAAKQERVRIVQELSAKTAVTLRDRTEQLRATTLDLDVAVGNLTAKEAKLLTVRRKAFIESLPALQELTKAISAQEAHVKKLEESNRGLADGGNLLANNYAQQTGAVHLINESMEEERANLAKLEASRTALLESLKKQVTAEVALVEAQDKGSKSSVKRLEGMSDELRLMQERASASNQLAQITASSSLAVLEGEARVTEEYRRQLAQIDELERVSQDHINADVARATVRVEYEQEVAAIRERNAKVSADHEKRLIDEVARARQESMRQGLDITGQAFGAMADGASRTYSLMIDDVQRLQDYQSASAEHLTGSQQKQLDRRIKNQKRAARNAFEAQKAAGAAAAAVQTAVAISTALASAPPPWNFALAGIAAAGGLAQQAAIMRQQPSFHKGGAVDMAPDEMAATVRKREFVLNPTGRDMLGDDTLKRANAGQRSGGGGEVVAVSVYKHTRQVDRWKRDGLNAGDPISRAITRGQLVGHRSNR